MQTSSNFIDRWGGPALMIGALIFSLTKARGYVDPDDSLLIYFMLVGFAAWIVGIAAFFVRYAPTSGRLGKTGLGISFGGILLVAAGHLLSEAVWNATGVDLFMLIILGVLALIVGPLLFGVASLRRERLPRRWRFVPLFIGVVGLMWIFSGSDDGSLTFAFMFFRTLFALGWLLMGYVLWSYRDRPVRQMAPAR
jgi:hypothetical protein